MFKRMQKWGGVAQPHSSESSGEDSGDEDHELAKVDLDAVTHLSSVPNSVVQCPLCPEKKFRSVSDRDSHLKSKVAPTRCAFSADATR